MIDEWKINMSINAPKIETHPTINTFCNKINQEINKNLNAVKCIFDYPTYLKCNKPACDAVKKCIENSGGVVTVEPYGQYGIDMKFELDHNTYYFDPEMVLGWDIGTFRFQFPTLHIPFRKWKFADYPNAYFCSVRPDCKVMYLTSAIHLKKSKLKNVPNYRNPEGELFFNILWKAGESIRVDLTQPNAITPELLNSFFIEEKYDYPEW